MIGTPRPHAQRSARPSHADRAIAVIAAVAILLVVGGCAVRVRTGTGSPGREPTAAEQGTCVAVPANDASPSARAYAAAVNSAVPAWEAVSATIVSQDYVTHHDDLLSQINADAPFVTALKQIRFAPDAAPAAANLIAAIEAYDDFLRTAYDDHGYLAAHVDTDKQLDNTRAASSARLRDALGLPESTCIFYRP